jgi:ABC-2 type transport system permease protein
MHNIWLITKREYLERIRTKGFLLATVLIPLLMGGLVFGAGYFATNTKSSSHVAVVTSDPRFGQDLKQQLESGKESRMIVDVDQPTAETRSRLDAQLHDRGSNLAGYLWITPPSSMGQRPVFSYTARSVGDIATKGAIESAVSSVLLREQLAAHGIGGQDVNALTAPVTLDTSATGNTAAAFGAAYAFFLLMYMVIMLYGMNTARSIIEEKTSRVFEVLLATIKPEELLAGKILGVGAVGLTQVTIWMVAALALVSTSVASNLLAGGTKAVISPAQAGFFLLYFVFGFLIYSSIAAALGAMTNSEQELQQLNMFLVMPLALCMLLLVSVVRAPDSALARVSSLIPFCSPLLMNLRISLTHVPATEIMLSVVLMTLTIIAILWVSSKIYRVGILMYGKKPNLPEIMRWLRYS